MAANVVVFLWMSRLPFPQRQVFAVRHGFVPARIGQLLDPKPLDVEIPQGRLWTPLGLQVRVIEYRLEPKPAEILLSLLTCMFLHGGWWHLIGNMWFLWIFGKKVEDRLGPAIYLPFYLTGGLVASGLQWAIAPHSTAPVIGASGAVAAVLGAYAITWPWARIDTFVFLFVFVTLIELPALFVLGLWFAGQVLEATRVLNPAETGLDYNTGVAWWAHVGGFVAGLLLMPPLGDLARALRGGLSDRPPPPPESPEEDRPLGT